MPMESIDAIYSTPYASAFYTPAGATRYTALDIQLGSGYALNPKTGKMEQVYATYTTTESGVQAETGFFFESDPFRPSSALSLQGFAPGYYTDNSSTFDNFLERVVLGGAAVLGAIAGAEVIGVAGGGASTTEAVTGATATEGAAATVSTTEAVTAGAGATAAAPVVSTTTAVSGVTAGSAAPSLLSQVGTYATKALPTLVGKLTSGGTAQRLQYLPQENRSAGLHSSIYGDQSGADLPRNYTPWILGGVALFILAMMLPAFFVRR
jgi:hypothetical protein